VSTCDSTPFTKSHRPAQGLRELLQWLEGGITTGPDFHQPRHCIDVAKTMTKLRTSKLDWTWAIRYICPVVQFRSILSMKFMFSDHHHLPSADPAAMAAVLSLNWRVNDR
jgi:hypothetical protein